MIKIILTCFVSILFLSSSGQSFQWAKEFNGNFTNLGKAVKYDAAGNVYTLGEFNSTVDFDPGPAVYNVASNPYISTYLSKLDANGNFLWVKILGGGTGQVNSSTLEIDASGNAYILGTFMGSADFDPGIGVFNLVPLGYQDIYI